MKHTLSIFVHVNEVGTTAAKALDFSSLVSMPHLHHKYVGMRRNGHTPKEAWKAVWGTARRHDECVSKHKTSSTMRRLMRGRMMLLMKQARNTDERVALLRSWRDTVSKLGGYPDYDRFGCAVSDNWDYDPDVITGFAETWVSHL